ncbi:MAG TPA: helicase-related protein, partial [Chloroflexia bacterium]|nr:helicase-related protein [Chloroflexia bacterium]
SQEKALDNFVSNLGGKDNCPVKYARYTGQESDSRKRELQENPPHILLTNYVMLELMLTRPEEQPFVGEASSDLHFLVLDELHTYRGRQGADVAMLVRRLRERSGKSHLQCVGTSATMSTGATRAERAEAVAEVASKIFGVVVSPENVIDETLRRSLSSSNSQQFNIAGIRAAINNAESLPDIISWDTFKKNPLAVWIEETFGLEVESDGRLKRRNPITLVEGARQLAKLTNLSEESCIRGLQLLFNAGSKVRSPEDIPAFAFKLHQFFSQGGSVYSTVEPPSTRYLTLEGQRYAPIGDSDKLLFPLVFCRECGQEHYLCIYNEKQKTVIPRPPFSREELSDRDALEGYLLVDTEGFWSDDQIDLLPENWFKELKRGRELKPEYAQFRPRQLWLRPDGSLTDYQTTNQLQETVTPCWFIPVPFLTCLRCGEVYTKRQSGDFGKLTRLSSEGRSTATTLLSLSTITQMRNDNSVKAEAKKLLSFTDNRQDASLQAGHFNDFVEVGLIRAAIYKALTKAPQGLDYTQIAERTVAELQLSEDDYAIEPSPNPRSLAAESNLKALQSLIEYRIFEDLRRGWRVTQPNLEQSGLLELNYKNLEEVCADEMIWQEHPLLAQTLVPDRANIIRVFLDYMRRELAINAGSLDRKNQDVLFKRVRDTLKSPWTFDQNEFLYSATCFVLPGLQVANRFERSLGFNTSLGRYLRSSKTWTSLDSNLGQEEYADLMTALIKILRGHGFLIGVETEAGDAIQVRSNCMLWCAGSGEALRRDPIRSRQMNIPHEQINNPNQFFANFYKSTALNLQGVEGREHTGQVEQAKREDREKRFREGQLSALFCSPTMELGIDISDLNVVHLRNVPPTPANYAQRSGRAGRSGQPALVGTYCSVGSGHDQYFFRRPDRMVAGVVAPPRLDLGNREMLEAHIHAVWLGITGLALGRSMLDIVDTADSTNNYPLQEKVKLALELSTEREAECFDICKRLFSSSKEDLSRNGWFSEKWLAETISNAAIRFNQACNRWRELFAAAERQLRDARMAEDRRYQSRGAKNNYEAEEIARLRNEALRQMDLLCNQMGNNQLGDSDFYPYRYFASEGFLPGYNFPRLPVHAYLNTGRENGTFLSRPRFLALTEFGPRNVIYHEGGKYRVVKVMLPGGNADSRMVTAKLCHHCNFFHEGQNALSIEICEHCGTRLDTNTSLTTSKLFEMTTVATQRIERITSEEEERVREGYFITSHFRFAGPKRIIAAQTRLESTEEDLLDLCYAPSATLWRINHRWKRANPNHEGYTLDKKKGIWAKRPNDDADNAIDADSSELISGVRLLVRDTRNILLLQPDQTEDEDLLASLQYALQRGIEAVFQVEEQELVSERVGEKDQRRILLWEAAEGGVGVLTRLVEEPEALAKVAREALEICHFDPETGEDLADESNDCGQACYRCLLSYSNQQDHARLKRHLVKEILLKLANSETKLKSAGSSDNEDSDLSNLSSFERLKARTAAGSFAREVLEYLNSTGRNLPDKVRPAFDGVTIQPDFYYQNEVTCIFCDETRPEPVELAQRDELDEKGYRVITLRKGQDLEKQLKRWSDVFER